MDIGDGADNFWTNRVSAEEGVPKNTLSSSSSSEDDEEQSEISAKNDVVDVDVPRAREEVDGDIGIDRVDWFEEEVGRESVDDILILGLVVC